MIDISLATSLVLGALLAAVSVIDARTKRIPDLLNAAILACGMATTALLDRSWLDAALGGALGYLSLFALNEGYRRMRGRDGIGMGDAKLLGALGVWTGWFGLPFILLGASSVGLAFAVLMQRRALEEIPFGPFIAAAGMLTWLALLYA